MRGAHNGQTRWRTTLSADASARLSTQTTRGAAGNRGQSEEPTEQPDQRVPHAASVNECAGHGQGHQ